MAGSSLALFGSPGETTSAADLEGTFSTLVQVEIIDDDVVDGNEEEIVAFLTVNGTISANILIRDNESKYILCMHDPTF